MANMQMNKTPMPEQAPDIRNANFKEVALGYTLEQAINEAQRCLQCKNPLCVSGCPVGIPIPQFLGKVAEGDIAAAYEILCEAQSVFFRHAPAPPRRMLRCKEYLDENVCDTSLRIGTLAKMCGVSEVYFRREFKSCYGTSPLEYIKRRRIEVACQLLSTGLYNVTQVAERAGFDSISYFSAEFRRLKGCTPSQYFNK